MRDLKSLVGVKLDSVLLRWESWSEGYPSKGVRISRQKSITSEVDGYFVPMLFIIITKLW